MHPRLLPVSSVFLEYSFPRYPTDSYSVKLALTSTCPDMFYMTAQSNFPKSPPLLHHMKTFILALITLLFLFDL